MCNCESVKIWKFGSKSVRQYVGITVGVWKYESVKKSEKIWIGITENRRSFPKVISRTTELNKTYVVIMDELHPGSYHKVWFLTQNMRKRCGENKPDYSGKDWPGYNLGYPASHLCDSGHMPQGDHFLTLLLRMA